MTELKSCLCKKNTSIKINSIIFQIYYYYILIFQSFSICVCAFFALCIQHCFVIDVPFHSTAEVSHFLCAKFDFFRFWIETWPIEHETWWLLFHQVFMRFTCWFISKLNMWNLTNKYAYTTVTFKVVTQKKAFIYINRLFYSQQHSYDQIPSSCLLCSPTQKQGMGKWDDPLKT